jgi:hypothetical protein
MLTSFIFRCFYSLLGLIYIRAKREDKLSNTISLFGGFIFFHLLSFEILFISYLAKGLKMDLSFTRGFLILIILITVYSGSIHYINRYFLNMNSLSKAIPLYENITLKIVFTILGVLLWIWALIFMLFATYCLNTSPY